MGVEERREVREKGNGVRLVRERRNTKKRES